MASRTNGKQSKEKKRSDDRGKRSGEEKKPVIMMRRPAPVAETPIPTEPQRMVLGRRLADNSPLEKEPTPTVAVLSPQQMRLLVETGAGKLVFNALMRVTLRHLPGH